MALFDKQDYFKLPLYFMEKIEGLTDEETGRVFKALYKYCDDESIPDFTGRCWDAWMYLKRLADYQEKHPKWRGGDIDRPQKERYSPKYIEWRNAVFMRDDYTCQFCGQKGGKINAHHIKHFAKYPQLRTVLSNGITLCEQCHKAVHRGDIECRTGS